MARNSRRNGRRNRQPVASTTRNRGQALRELEPEAAQAQSSTSADTEDEYINELVNNYSNDYPTEEEEEEEEEEDNSDNSSSISSSFSGRYDSPENSNNNTQNEILDIQDNLDREGAVSNSNSTTPREFTLINTQFSPTVVRYRRNFDRRQSEASSSEADNSSSSSSSSDGRAATNEPIVIDTTQPSHPSSSIQLVMDPQSPQSLSRPPPNEDTQPNNIAPGRSNKRKRVSTKRSKEKKKEGKETAEEHGKDKRLRSEGTSKDSAGDNGGSTSTSEGAAAAAKTRIMFKCAVCLDLPDPAVFVHPCGHVFCEACAQGAVQSTRKCPVCRHQMRARDIRVLQFRIANIKR